MIEYLLRNSINKVLEDECGVLRRWKDETVVDEDMRNYVCAEGRVIRNSK